MATASEIMAAAQTAASVRPEWASIGIVVLSILVLKRSLGALTNE
jgi:hypothetical protein